MSFIPGEKELVPTGYEAITVNTAIGITATVLTPASGVYSGVHAVGASISIETDAIRYTIDGTTPTSSIGHKIAADDIFYIFGKTALANLRMIKITNNASAKVTVFHVGAKMA
jgi:hypothetical protein